MEAFDLIAKPIFGRGKRNHKHYFKVKSVLDKTASDDKWQLASQTRCTPGHSSEKMLLVSVLCPTPSAQAIDYVHAKQYKGLLRA